MKRMIARARGSGSRILKRTSHIRIVLSDEIPIETRETKKAKKKQEEKAAKQEGATGEAVGKTTAKAEEKTSKAKKTGQGKTKK